MPQYQFFKYILLEIYAVSVIINVRVTKHFLYHLIEFKLNSKALKNLNIVISKTFWSKKPDKITCIKCRKLVFHAGDLRGLLGQKNLELTIFKSFNFSNSVQFPFDDRESALLLSHSFSLKTHIIEGNCR